MSIYRNTLKQLGFEKSTVHKNGQGRISNFSSISRQLFEAHCDEYNPCMSRILATAVKRYINTRPKCEKRTREFVNEIRRKILCLHEYNLQIAQVKYKYPRSEQFDAVLMQYVELECGLLYDTHKEVNQEEEQNAIERILRLLRVIGYDSHYNNEVSAKTSTELCDKALLKLFGHLSADYICENRVVASIIVKLLSKLNLLEEINKLKGKNVPFQQDTFLKDPLVCTIRQTLASSDYESDLNDDDDDLIISDDFFPHKEEVKKDDTSQKYGFPETTFSATSKQEVRREDLENPKNNQNCVYINNSTDCSLTNNSNIQDKSDNFLRAASTANLQTSIEKNRSLLAPISGKISVPSNFLSNENSESSKDFFHNAITNQDSHKFKVLNNLESENFLSNTNQNQDTSLKNQEDIFLKKTHNETTVAKFEEKQNSDKNEVKVSNGPQIDNGSKDKTLSDTSSSFSSEQSPVIEIDDTDEFNTATYALKPITKSEKITESTSNSNSLTVDLDSIPDNSYNKKSPPPPTTTESLNGGIIIIDLLDDDDDDLGINSNGTESQSSILNNSTLLQTNEIKQEENEENRSPNFPVSNTGNSDQTFLNSDKSSRSSNSTGLNKMEKNSKDSAKEMEASAIVISDSEDELVDGSSECNDEVASVGIDIKTKVDDAKNSKDTTNEIQVSEEHLEELKQKEIRLHEEQNAEVEEIQSNFNDKNTEVSLNPSNVDDSTKIIKQQIDVLSAEKSNEEVLEEFQDFMNESVDGPCANDKNPTSQLPETHSLPDEHDVVEALTSEEIEKSSEELSEIEHTDHKSDLLRESDFVENNENQNISSDEVLESQKEIEVSLNVENEQNGEFTNDEETVPTNVPVVEPVIEECSETPENTVLSEEKLVFESEAIIHNQEHTPETEESQVDTTTENVQLTSDFEEVSDVIQESLEHNDLDTGTPSLENVNSNEENLQEKSAEIYESCDTLEINTANSSKTSIENDNNKAPETSIENISNEVTETQEFQAANYMADNSDSQNVDTLHAFEDERQPELQTCESLNKEVLLEEQQNIIYENEEVVQLDENGKFVEVSSENTIVDQNFTAVPQQEEILSSSAPTENMKRIEGVTCEAIDYSVSHLSPENVNYQSEEPLQNTDFYQIQDKSAVYNPQLEVSPVAANLLPNVIPHIPDESLSEKLDNKSTNVHEPLSLLADLASNRETLAVKTDSEKETVPSDFENPQELDLSQTTPRRRRSKIRFERKKKSSPRQVLPRAVKQSQTKNLLKQKITYEEFENKRITRNMGTKSKTDTKVVKETQKPIRPNRTEDSKYKPHDFISMENAILPPVTNNVYAQKRLVDTTTTSEDSNDSCESTLFIDLGENLKHPEKVVKSIFDEETIFDDLQFINTEDKATVCISIPENEENYVCDSFHILKQMEDFVDKNEKAVSSNIDNPTENINEKLVQDQSSIENSDINLEVDIPTDINTSLSMEAQEDAKTVKTINHSIEHILNKSPCTLDTKNVMTVPNSESEDTTILPTEKCDPENLSIEVEKSNIDTKTLSSEQEKLNTMTLPGEKCELENLSTEVEESLIETETLSSEQEKSKTTPLPTEPCEPQNLSVVAEESVTGPESLCSEQEKSNTATLPAGKCEPENLSMEVEKSNLETEALSSEQEKSSLESQNLSIEIQKPSTDDNNKEPEHSQNKQDVVSEEISSVKETSISNVSTSECDKESAQSEVIQPENREVQVENMETQPENMETQYENREAQHENPMVEKDISVTISDDVCEKAFKTKAAMKSYEDRSQETALLLEKTATVFTSLDDSRVGPRLRSRSSDQFSERSSIASERNRSISVDFNSMSFTSDSSHNQSSDSSAFEETQVSESVIDSVIESVVEKLPLDVNLVEKTKVSDNIVDAPVLDITPKEVEISTTAEAPVVNDISVYHSSEVILETDVDMKSAEEIITENTEVAKQVTEDKPIQNVNVAKVPINNEFKSETAITDVVANNTESLERQDSVSKLEDQTSKHDETSNTFIKAPTSNLKKSLDKSSSEKISKSRSSDEVKGRSLENTIKTLKEKIQGSEKAKKELTSETPKEIENTTHSSLKLPDNATHTVDDVVAPKEKTDSERKHHKKTSSEERPRSTDSSKDDHKKRRSSRSPSKSRSDKSDHSDKERRSHKSSRSRSSSKSRSSDKRSKHHSDNESDRKRRSSSKSFDDKDKRSASNDDPNGHKKKSRRSPSKSKNTDDKSKRNSMERTSSKHKTSELKEKTAQNEDERDQKKRSSKSPSRSKSRENKDKQVVLEKKDKSEDLKSKSEVKENKIKPKTDDNEKLKVVSLEVTKHSDSHHKTDHKSSKEKTKKHVSSKLVENHLKKIDPEEKIEKSENKSQGLTSEIQKSSDKEKHRESHKSKSKENSKPSHDTEKHDSNKKDEKNSDKSRRSHSKDKTRLDNNHRNDKREKSDKYKQEKKSTDNTKEVDTNKRKEKKKEEEKLVNSESKQKNEEVETRSDQQVEAINNLVPCLDKSKEIIEPKVDSTKEKHKNQKVDLPKKRKCDELETSSDLPPVKISKVIEEKVVEKAIDRVNKKEKLMNEIPDTNTLETVSCTEVQEVSINENSSTTPSVATNQPKETLPVPKTDLLIDNTTTKDERSVVPQNETVSLIPEKEQTQANTSVVDTTVVIQTDESSSSDMEICENVQSSISEGELTNKNENPTEIATQLILQNEIDPITSSESVPIYVSAVFSSSPLVPPMDSIVKHLPGQDTDLSLAASVSRSLTTDCIASTAVSISCTVSTTVPLDNATTSTGSTCLFACNEDTESVNRENITPSEIFHTPIGLDDISPTKLPLACNQSLDFISPSTSIAEISNSMNLVQSLESSPINFEVPDTSEIDIQPTNKQNLFCSNFVTRVTEISCFVDKESNADHNYTGGDPLLGGNNEEKAILTTGLSLSNPKEFSLNESHLEDLSFGKNYFVEDNGTLEELDLLPPCKKEKPDFDTIIDDPIPKPEDIQVSLKQLNMLMDNPQSSQPKTNSVDNSNMINTGISDLGFEYAVNEILFLRETEVTSQTNSFPTIPDIENINITESSVPVIPQVKPIPPEAHKDKSNESNSLATVDTVGSTLPPVSTSFSTFVSENQKVIVQPVEHFSITSVDQLKSDFIPTSNKNGDKSKTSINKHIDTNGKLQPKHRPKKFATFLEVVKNEANKVEPPKVKDEMEIYTLRRHNRTPVVSSKKKVVNQSPPTKSPSQNSTKPVYPPEGRIRVKTDLIKTDSKSDGEYINEHDQNIASEVVLPLSKPSPSLTKTEEKKIEILPKANLTKHPRFDKMGNDYIMENILNNSLRKSSTPDLKKREESSKILDKKRKSLDEMCSDEKRARKSDEEEKRSTNNIGSPAKNSINKSTTDEIFDALRRQGPVNKEYIRQLEEQKKKQSQNNSTDPLNRGYSTDPYTKKDRNSVSQSTSTYSHDSSKYKDVRYQKKPEFHTSNSNSHSDRRYTEKSHITVPIVDASRKRHIKNCGNSVSNLFPNSTKPQQRKEEDKFSWLDKFSGSGLFDPPPDLFMPPGTEREDKSS